jgi:hypothetical protein
MVCRKKSQKHAKNLKWLKWLKWLKIPMAIFCGFLRLFAANGSPSALKAAQ